MLTGREVLKNILKTEKVKIDDKTCCVIEGCYFFKLYSDFYPKGVSFLDQNQARKVSERLKEYFTNESNILISPDKPPSENFIYTIYNCRQIVSSSEDPLFTIELSYAFDSEDENYFSPSHFIALVNTQNQTVKYIQQS